MEIKSGYELEQNYRATSVDEFENNDVDFPEELSEYPSKPIIFDEKQSILKSLSSIVIFAVAFYFLFGWDVISLTMLIGVILVHELGHFVAMKLFNYKDLSIFFIPLVGAYASGEIDEVSQRQQIIISLAGPVPGIIIGSLLVYFGLVTENNLLYKPGAIFLLLNLFNLLPVLPMDGGRIIQTLFFHQKETITIVLLWVSIGLFGFYGIYTENWIILLICFLIFMQINARTKNIKVKRILKEKGFDTNKSFSELTNAEYWKIRGIMASNMRVIGNLTTPDNYSEVPDEKTIIKTMKNIVQKPPVKTLGVWGKVVFFLIWLFSFTIPVIITLLLMFLNRPL